VNGRIKGAAAAGLKVLKKGRGGAAVKRQKMDYKGSDQSCRSASFSGPLMHGWSRHDPGESI
jgi:hypothetical protein